MKKDPRTQYVDKVKVQVGEIEAAINNLEFKLDEADWEPMIDYKKQVDELRLRLEDIKQKVRELEVKSEATLPEFKQEIEDSLQGLGDHLRRVSSNLDKITLE
ncbi:MAG: hypothetical protein ACLFVG_05245 [Candidatus Aminicenantes bacterium]